MTSLVGCTATDVIKLTEDSASLRCLQLASLQMGLPELDSKTETMVEGQEPPAPPTFRFVSTGQFVTTFASVILPGAKKASAIICTGDFNRRLITSLQIVGTVSRPAKPEDWVFA